MAIIDDFEMSAVPDWDRRSQTAAGVETVHRSWSDINGELDQVELTKCPACDGFGTVCKNQLDECRCYIYCPAYEPVPCVKCGGTGKMEDDSLSMRLAEELKESADGNL